jgi:hypothetical protein
MQQDKIKRTLQYPKAGRGHVNLFIFLFERLIKIEHSAAYQEFSAWTSSEGSAIFTYPSVIEINSRTSFFAVSALTCGLHIVIYF